MMTEAMGEHNMEIYKMTQSIISNGRTQYGDIPDDTINN